MLEESSSEDFWERHYKGVPPKSSGRPSAVLTKFVARRRPQRALELGCAKGDDTVWLARQGWQVTAVDVSETALDYARQNAEAAGVGDLITLAKHDLSQSFPAGQFELVNAVFLESPVNFPRVEVLRRAAEAVAPKGLLIVASHGSIAPWSWADPDTVFPTAEENLKDLELEMSDWKEVFVGPSLRQATGPGGQMARVTDILLILERRSF